MSDGPACPWAFLSRAAGVHQAQRLASKGVTTAAAPGPGWEACPAVVPGVRQAAAALVDWHIQGAWYGHRRIMTTTVKLAEGIVSGFVHPGARVGTSLLCSSCTTEQLGCNPAITAVMPA